ARRIESAPADPVARPSRPAGKARDDIGRSHNSAPAPPHAPFQSANTQNEAGRSTAALAPARRAVCPARSLAPVATLPVQPLAALVSRDGEFSLRCPSPPPVPSTWTDRAWSLPAPRAH